MVVSHSTQVKAHGALSATTRSHEDELHCATEQLATARTYRPGQDMATVPFKYGKRAGGHWDVLANENA